MDYPMSSLIISGDTSGSVTIQAPAIAGTNTIITLPNSSVTIPNTIGYPNIPAVGSKNTSYTIATTDIGKYIELGSAGTIVVPNNTFQAGDAVMLFNNTGNSIQITCSATTTYVAGTNTVRTSANISTRGIATVVYMSNTFCIITGAVT